MRGRLRRISREKFPRRTLILSIPSKPYSFHSVHSAIRSRINGMIFRPFRKRNRSQKNTNTVYSEYSYFGLVPKERAPNFYCYKVVRTKYRKLKCRVKSREPEIKRARNICFYVEILLFTFRAQN